MWGCLLSGQINQNVGGGGRTILPIPSTFTFFKLTAYLYFDYNISDKHALMSRFDYVHFTMGLTHQQVLEWPNILRTRLFIVRQRHKFLESIGRAQYKPHKENYVTLKALVSGSDKDFCSNVAKVSTKQFNGFLKTL